MTRALWVLLLSAAGCVVPGRIGPTSYDDGSKGLQFTAALTTSADLGPVRAGGGPMIDVLMSDHLDLIEVGGLGRADFVLYPIGKHRQAILATRLTVGVGLDSYSFSTFVGPGYALRTQHDSSSAPWHTIALGLAAKRVVVDGYYPAWLVGIGLEVSYAFDIRR